MSTPVIGFTPNTGVPVDLSRLIESRLLIQANSGGGKSTAIRYVLEQTFGRVQHLVIDREGEFATLRAQFPYVLVGREGEVAADRRTAKLLARRLLERDLSAIIDLSEMTPAEQRAYVAEFVSTLNHLPRALWKDVLVVIDEAHVFAPEKGKGESVATEPIAMLASTGRKRGYCAVLATQRLAKLNKDVAAECLNKWIGRTSQDDVARAADELGQARGAGRELRALEPGTFWAYGPAIGAEPVLVRTGSVVSAPPVRGAARAPVAPTPSKIRAAIAELADLPREAAEEAQSIDALRRENGELQRRVHQMEKGGAERVVTKPVTDQAAIERAVLAARQSWTAEMRRIMTRQIKALDDKAVRLATLGSDIACEVREIETFLGEVEIPARHVAPPEPQPNAIVIPSTLAAIRSPARNDGALPAGERAVLTAIAQQPHGAERDQISILTGYKRSSRDTYIQRLGAKGLVAVDGARVTATDAGVDALGADFEPLPTGDALRRYWLERLPEGERRILGVLIDAYPEMVRRDALDDATGYKRSSRDTYLQRLAARRLVLTTGRVVRASANLFSGGTR